MVLERMDLAPEAWEAQPVGEELEDAGWVERTLRERARLLARVPERTEDADGSDVLLFRLREESYAVDLALLRKVHLARGLTPVPCTPPHVAGILNVRGEVVTVLDLASALGLGDRLESTDSTRILLVELPEGRVGLLVDEVMGDRRVDLANLDVALSGKEYTRGVAEGSVVLLDLARLLSGGRFEVQEEIV